MNWRLSFQAIAIFSLLLLSAALADDKAVEDATESPRLVVQLAHQEDVTSMAVSADGKFIATGDGDGRVVLWHAATGKELRELHTPSDKKDESPDPNQHVGVVSLGFSPNSAFIIAAIDQTIFVWERISGRNVLAAKVEEPCWAFAPDSQRLFIGHQCWSRSEASGIFVNPLAEPEPEEAEGDEPESAAPNEDLAPPAPPAPDAPIEAPVPRAPAEEAAPQPPIAPPPEAPPAPEAAPAKDPSLLRKLFDWYIGAPQPAAPVEDAPAPIENAPAPMEIEPEHKAIAFGADRSFDNRVLALTVTDKWLAQGDNRGAINVYDLETRSQHRELWLTSDTKEDHGDRSSVTSEAVTALAWMKDGRLLAGGRAGTVALLAPLRLMPRVNPPVEPPAKKPLDVEEQGASLTRRQIALVSFAPEGNPVDEPIGWRVALRDTVERLTFSPDEKYVVVRTTHAFHVLDCQDGKRVKLFARYRATSCGVFSPDGKTILTGHSDRVVRLWDAKTGKLLRRFEGAWGGIGDVTFVNGGPSIAAIDSRDVLTVWNSHSGALMRQGQIIEEEDRAPAGVIEAPAPPAPPAPAEEAPSPQANATPYNPFRLIGADPEETKSTTPKDSSDKSVPGRILLNARDILVDRDEWWRQDRNDPEYLLAPTVPGMFCQNGKLLIHTRVRGVKRFAAIAVASGEKVPFPPKDFAAEEIKAISSDTKSMIVVRSKPGEGTWFTDQEFWLSEFSTGKLIRKIAESTFYGVPNRACISADKAWIAIDDGGNRVRILEAATGRLHGRLSTGMTSIAGLAFPPRATQVVIAGSEGRMQIWDRNQAKHLRNLAGHDLMITSVKYSPDGARLLSTSSDETARVWDVLTGKQLLRMEEAEPSLAEVAFLNDGSLYLASHSGIAEVRQWPGGEVAARRQLAAPEEMVWTVCVNHADRRVLVNAISLAATQLAYGTRLSIQPIGNENRSLAIIDSATSRTTYGQFACFRPGSSEIISVSATGVVRTWNQHGLARRRNLDDDKILRAEPEMLFAANRRYVLAAQLPFASPDDLRVWDLTTGKLIDLGPFLCLPLTDRYATNDEFDVGESNDLIDIKAKRVVRRFPMSARLDVSNDNRRLLSTKTDGTVTVWDLPSMKEVRRFKAVIKEPKPKEAAPAPVPPAPAPDPSADASRGRFALVRFADDPIPQDPIRIAAKFSPTARYVITHNEADYTSLNYLAWHTDKGVLHCKFEEPKFKGRPMQGNLPNVTGLVFSPDERWMAVFSSERRLIVVWNVATGKVSRIIPAMMNENSELSFSPDGRLILQSATDNSIYLWECETGKLACRLVMLDDENWAVVDPEGRFDAPNGGDVSGLHWVIKEEPIDLDQLKERYYEPDLLGKKLGLIKEPVRDVKALGNPKLPPAVVVSPVPGNDGQAEVVLTNRGGGIGRVVAKLNGKEITPDARGPALDPKAQEVRIRLDIAPHERLIKAGQNVVHVEAYNSEGYMRSRGFELLFEAPELPEAEKPQLWLVACGVSAYRGERLRSPYASKDAQDISQALRIAAQRLFGATRVHAAVLSSSATEPALQPTRENLVRALQEARAAKTNDILVVYLAGHGVTSGGQDGDFYYLCSDALSDELRDQQLRDQVALSSAKLTELITDIPALKQVMILDTCAAGRVIEELTKKRDVPSGQTRALDRLKDRTGMYVLAGCAADAVSYEASRYRQGVLTYSLLMGLRGAALRDEQFVDVERLFNYSVDTVPSLAVDVGGIQKPRISAPHGGSFDIGELTTADRSQVPLQPIRPLVIRSSFQEETTFDDTLNLSKSVDDLLRESAFSGTAKFVFVDGRGMPDSYRLVGRYQTVGERTKVTTKLFHDTKLARKFTVEAASKDPSGLAKKLLGELERTLATLPRRQ